MQKKLTYFQEIITAERIRKYDILLPSIEYF